MRLSRRAILEPLLMAAIVTTLWAPPAAIITLLGCALLDLSIRSVVTLGDVVNAPAGLALWWMIGFVPALAYAIVFRPWSVLAPDAP